MRANHGLPIAVTGEIEQLPAGCAALVEVENAALVYGSAYFAHWAFTSSLFHDLPPPVSVDFATAGAFTAVGPTAARVSAIPTTAETSATLDTIHPRLFHRLHSSFHPDLPA